MTLAKAEARVSTTFIVQASLTIVTLSKYFYSTGHRTYRGHHWKGKQNETVKGKNDGNWTGV